MMSAEDRAYTLAKAIATVAWCEERLARDDLPIWERPHTETRLRRMRFAIERLTTRDGV